MDGRGCFALFWMLLADPSSVAEYMALGVLPRLAHLLGDYVFMNFATSPQRAVPQCFEGLRRDVKRETCRVRFASLLSRNPLN